MSEQELRNALQAAQAECAVLRSALQMAWPYLNEHLQPGFPDEAVARERVQAALSGDAGAAFLAEYAAMRRVVEGLREYRLALDDQTVEIAYANRLLLNTLGYLKAFDDLSAPAVEPEWESALDAFVRRVEEDAHAEQCCPGGVDRGDCSCNDRRR